MSTPKFVSVGPVEDEPNLTYLPDGTTLVVYWYEAGSYEGSGTAFALAGDQWLEKNLGHCSCYGPWEPDGGGWDTLTHADIRMKCGPDANPEMAAIGAVVLPMVGGAA